MNGVCDRDGCTSAACWVPAIFVPYADALKLSPLKLVFSLELCDADSSMEALAKIVGDPEQSEPLQKIRLALGRSGKMIPDLKRTTIRRVPLEDPDYQILLNQRKKQRDAALAVSGGG